MPAAKKRTLALISAPRAPRPSQQKRPAKPKAQQVANQNAAASRREAIANAVQTWVNGVHAEAERLGQQFDLSGRYFLDQLYYGSREQIHQREAGNAYNAFYALKAKDLREEGVDVSAESIVSLHAMYDDEYHALTSAEKKQLIARHKEDKALEVWTRRQTNGAKMRDMLNTHQIAMDLFNGLRRRTGAEAFYVVVSGEVEFAMDPKWYFTNKKIDEYLKIAGRNWETNRVGYKIQAFCQAGCDVTNLARNTQEHASLLKKEIIVKINSALSEATGIPDSTMEYVNYHSAIVQKMGVVLEGWPLDELVQPSRLGNTIAKLKMVRDALADGTCTFRKIDNAEKERLYREYREKVANGEIVEKARKTRTDKGILRGPRVLVADDDNINEADDDLDCGDDNDESHESPTSTGTDPASNKRKRSKKDGAPSGVRSKRLRKDKGKNKENVPPPGGPSPAQAPSE
ncbi:hypothetical protein FISHEDRAFT_73839 [Fistulina hepatica ATCC 64428]|uniref:Uncharacterized protein n=1 Tax=Fistulina hepatica ATCC 64428 TaxID=1128425 RepID=A0A0D7AC76_9AGAR|nr:hypothetical protein FISHEDRAFT_73839 [Fistulina hepatica ATCC 64428]